jgi:hypothetical protein
VLSSFKSLARSHNPKYNASDDTPLISRRFAVDF